MALVSRKTQHGTLAVTPTSPGAGGRAPAASGTQHALLARSLAAVLPFLITGTRRVWPVACRSFLVRAWRGPQGQPARRSHAPAASRAAARLEPAAAPRSAARRRRRRFSRQEPLGLLNGNDVLLVAFTRPRSAVQPDVPVAYSCSPCDPIGRQEVEGRGGMQAWFTR
jgi:hypothetical protein